MELVVSEALYQNANNSPKLLFLLVALVLIALGTWRVRTAESGAKSANVFYERLPGSLHFQSWFMKLGGIAFIIIGLAALIIVIVSPSPWI